MANATPVSNWYLLLLCSLCSLILASAIWVSISLLSNGRPKNDKEPDSLRAPYWIPGLGNAYQYIFHNMDFLQYVIAVRNGREVLQFRLGPKRVYLVCGAKQVDKVLRHGGTLSADEQTATMLQRMASVTKSDIEKFRSDSSGRGKIPLTNVPEDKRIWHAHHRLTMDHLSSPQAVQVMAGKFCELFSETLLSVCVGKWETVRVYDFLQKHMFNAAVAAMAGTKFLESEPHFVENFWKYDRGVYPLILGTPRLLRPGIYAARDAFHEHGKYFEQARASFDWNGPDAEANWEPIFGSRFSREQAKFLEAWGFESKSKAGMTVGALWAQNANTIPITAWAMIEIIKDQDLLKAIKEEVATAAAFDITKRHKLNIKKLSELPLLQSVYTETLRMHVSVNVTREVTGDMHMGGFVLKKGSLVQTPTWIAHFDETVWSHIDHPATEFWAARHLKYDKNIPQFSVAKKSVGFFPFGGGVSICPGRHFAKVEVMAAIALLVMNFDMEFVEYTCLDGTESGRGPKDDERYCGSAAMPPDRDMKVRWKRC